MSSRSISYTVAATGHAKLNAGSARLVLENIDKWQVFIDGAIFQSLRLSGYAWIMEDRDTHFQLASSGFFGGLFLVSIIEAMTLNSALQWLVSHSQKSDIIFTDSK